MDGLEFIRLTDGRSFYIESFLRSILYGYFSMLDKRVTYSRSAIHKKIKALQRSEKAHNELEDYLCSELIKKFVRPNLGLFGLEEFVVNNGVKEEKEGVTLGHLDVKFQIKSLSSDDYYAFEAKRLDKTAKKQKYYISGGIERFTTRKYYTETEILAAGMIGFVEIDLDRFKKSRVEIAVIKDSLVTLIKNNETLNTTQNLVQFRLNDENYLEIHNFNHLYLSKHIRDEDSSEMSIYHMFLDYYDLITT